MITPSASSKYKTVADVQSLLLSKVAVSFGQDKSIVGILMRNSFANETLCIDTNPDAVGQSGKFFFEPNQMVSIHLITPAI